ncbi:DUF305 domain-containing protein [Nonomuraea sp. NPDC003804]|uniref:DUF305 domain-containing protein n=1 Tax=Nonomuraea sp. NPDC003804 TaxID=3154547 RepID=UPI0033B0E393
MDDNRSAIRRLALTAVAGAASLAVLTACGGGATAGHGMSATGAPAVTTTGAGPGMSATGSPAVTPTGAQPGAGFNDADVMFAQMMIPHHQQAVEMAELAGTRASGAEVKDLAVKIKAAQDPEIRTLRGWLKDWGKPESAGHMAGHGMSGMMSEDDLKKLEAAKGAAFDRLFAQQMIAHHNGAIEMARTEQAQGSSPAAKELAKTIETTQQAEVAQLQQILDRL